MRHIYDAAHKSQVEMQDSAVRRARSHGILPTREKLCANPSLTPAVRVGYQACFTSLLGILLLHLSCANARPACRAADLSCNASAAILFLPQATQDWLVMVGNGGAVYYSSDLGRTWSAGASGIADNLVGVVYAGKNRWVAVGTNDRMMYSDDGGASWKPASAGSSGVNHQALAAGNGTLLAAGTVANVFLSLDRGLTWSSIASPIAAVKNNADFACGQFIFASNAQVAYTSDGANAALSGAMPNFPTGKAACKGTRIIMATGAAPFAYYSDDMGPTWTAGGAGIGTIRRAVRLLGTQLFAFGDDTLVYTSNDGTSWAAGASAPAGSIKDAVAMDSQRMVVTGGAGTATVFYTENGGQSWISVTGFPAVPFTSIAFGRLTIGP